MRRSTWLVLVCLGSGACIMSQLAGSIAQAAETDDPEAGGGLRAIEATRTLWKSEEQRVSPYHHP